MGAPNAPTWSRLEPPKNSAAIADFLGTLESLDPRAGFMDDLEKKALVCARAGESGSLSRELLTHIMRLAFNGRERPELAERAVPRRVSMSLY